jgi:hypothetical protein
MHLPAVPTPSWPARRRLLAIAALGLAGVTGRASAESVNAPLERSVKAAFLFKFLAYTDFPASAFADAAAPVTIGVAGADQMAAELTRIVAGRTVHNRPIVVRTFRESDTPTAVHLLFVGGADPGRLQKILKSIQPAPMLVVTDTELGLQHGSVINFKIVEERVRFDVSLEAADKNNVKLSSRLLTVANHVHKGAP